MKKKLVPSVMTDYDLKEVPALKAKRVSDVSLGTSIAQPRKGLGISAELVKGGDDEVISSAMEASKMGSKIGVDTRALLQKSKKLKKISEEEADSYDSKRGYFNSKKK